MKNDLVYGNMCEVVKTILSTHKTADSVLLIYDGQAIYKNLIHCRERKRMANMPPHCTHRMPSLNVVPTDL